MARILALILLIVVASPGGAWARTHALRHPRVHTIRASGRVRRVRRHTVRHGRSVPIHHRSRLAALAASQDGRTKPEDGARFEDAATGPSEHPGWFKARHEAGWGFSNDRATTVVGLYQRPGKPDGLPQNPIYHQDSRGAAGVSLSFKLGR